MKLFFLYIGGKTSSSLIEAHDVRFCVGQTIEDCYDQLRSGWWGTPESLHIDCYGVLEHADGYDIELKETSSSDNMKLFFVNLGGYDQNEFTELHKNVFVVAENESKAKVKALKQILSWQSHHQDNQVEVENIICLNNAPIQKLHIHLQKNEIEKPFNFICKYHPINSKTA